MHHIALVSNISTFHIDFCLKQREQPKIFHPCRKSIDVTKTMQCLPWPWAADHQRTILILPSIAQMAPEQEKTQSLLVLAKNVRSASLVCCWAPSCSLGIFLLTAVCSTKRKVLASRPMSSSKMTFYPSGWPWPSVVCFTNILSLRRYRCALPHCHCLHQSFARS